MYKNLQTEGEFDLKSNPLSMFLINHFTTINNLDQLGPFYKAQYHSKLKLKSVKLIKLANLRPLISDCRQMV